MAALESSRIHNLIDRILSLPGRTDPPAVFDIVKPDFAAVRTLTEASVASGEDQDRDWLTRTELRSTNQVVTMLESTGFAECKGVTWAIFVDGRCGLIDSQPVGNSGDMDADAIVGHVLRAASTCHAQGIILATHRSARQARRCLWRQINQMLRSKGEAIDIFLLDHLVLTRSGWSRMSVRSC